MQHISTLTQQFLDEANICTQCYKFPCQCDIMLEKHEDAQMFGDEAEQYDQDLDLEEDYEEDFESDEDDEEEDWLDEDDEWDEDD